MVLNKPKLTNKIILVDALYINKSGGKVLLEFLIKTLIKEKSINDYYFLFDVRLKSEFIDFLHPSVYEFVKPNELRRFLFYFLNFKKFFSVFCFANVPPPFIYKIPKVTIYFHNLLLLDSGNINLNFIQKLKLFLKKHYIRLCNNHKYIWCTQSKYIQNILHNTLSIPIENIKILPFFDINNFIDCNKQLSINNINYLYVADSSIQKNHINLLTAWIKFFEDNYIIKPILHLTLNTSSDLSEMIKKMNIQGYNIINHGQCDIKTITKLYAKCNYVLFPSLSESFGLPLIEAASAGCKVIASDLQFVHEVIVPSLVFNPLDINSIYLALSQSLDYDNIKKTTLLAENKINHLLNSISYVSK